MPEPVGRGQRYMPGLDGIRALAVAAVVAFHLGVPFVPGGLLGVGVFFTLSGYLITDLLLSSWERTGTLQLKTFWLRRARRLLPALFVMLSAVSVWAAVAAPAQLRSLRGAVTAAVFYVSNWWLAAQHISYFQRFGTPSPLEHLWSLAVEEQFYLIWPWLLLGGLVWLTRRRRLAAAARVEVEVATVGPAMVPARDAQVVPQLAYAQVGAPISEGAAASDGSPSYGGQYGPVRASAMAGGIGGFGRRQPLPPPLTRRVVPGTPPEGAGAGAGDGQGRVADLRALGEMFHGRAPTFASQVPREPMLSRFGGYLGVPGTRRWLWPLAVATLVLAALSAVEMGLLYQPSFDLSRVYEGTDTRAFGLLFGAALAMAWPSTGLRPLATTGARRLLNLIGWFGLVGVVVLVLATNQYSPFLYRGGLVLLSLATVMLIASATHPGGRVGTVLGCRPLRWLGVRSYGIYVWHFPLIALTTPQGNRGTDVPRALLQVAATLTLADISWRYIESPIRQGAIGRLWKQLREARRPLVRAMPPSRWATLAVVPVGLALVVASLAGYMPSAPAGELAVSGTPDLANQPPSSDFVGTFSNTTTTVVTRPTSVPRSVPTTAATPPPADNGTSRTGRTARTTGTSRHVTATTRHKATATTAKGSTGTGTTATSPHRTGTTKPVTTTPPAPPSFQTSCKEVVHIGDSTSESLVSSSYLPVASQRLPAQYARVGVTESIMRIVGGTSVVETIPGTENAYQMAKSLIASGYHGCWVIALGTNDAADIYVGSNVGVKARVERMMSVIGKQPVMWVNVKTLLSSGPYSEPNMQSWDNGVQSECSRYPNMRVFNWAGMAKPSWFISDGIHYSSQGSAPRAAAIADALARAFPAHPPTKKAKGRATSCVVNGSPGWDLPAFRD